MSMIDNAAVIKFFENEVSSLLKLEFGTKSFEDLRPILAQIKRWISEMIKISENTSLLPRELTGKIYDYVNTYNSLANDMLSYNMDVDAPTGFENRNRIILRVQSLQTVILSGDDTDVQKEFKHFRTFLAVYNTLKIEGLKSLANTQKELSGIVIEIANKKKEYEALVLELKKKAAEVTTSDYAALFEAQAYSHSHSKLQRWKWSSGSAEKWLIASVAAIAGFVYLLFNITKAIPVQFQTNATDITIQLLTRLVVLSFFIYLVTIVIKQYSIQKHLATLNTHRKNVLNSFNLFIQAIDKEDTQTRNALMLEVAKAIYESGQTGYVNSKDGDGSSSMIELTKYITPGKGS